MTNSQINVWIYVTNISTPNQFAKVSKLLNALDHIIKWTIDTNDKDNVLRVLTNEISEEEISNLIENNGICCHPMAD